MANQNEKIITEIDGYKVIALKNKPDKFLLRKPDGANLTIPKELASKLHFFFIENKI